MPTFSTSGHLLGLVGAKLQNATSDFFELDLSKNHSPVKWLP
ncbi:helix-turn-helix domain-containing protein (plasmid) [Klebsiella pneumoniae subsp. pneumoniae DSM 30104 = JCM 1662 = NBRC 14940]|nr:helix-turn-helix domain-containing protein [Klebsiella pneumoniae subsp. pneumoniae DSM 30104 = JCM 1662 = NBRC 14940]